MMNTINIKSLIIGIIVALLACACEETPMSSDPCADGQWATAVRNGKEHCMGELEVNYFHANTASAKIIFSASSDNSSLIPEIYVEFSIPVEGIALNTPYPVLTGRIYDADEIREGSITLHVFDPPAQGKSGTITGTFNLKAYTRDIMTFEYLDGQFIFNK